MDGSSFKMGNGKNLAVEHGKRSVRRESPQTSENVFLQYHCRLLQSNTNSLKLQTCPSKVLTDNRLVHYFLPQLLGLFCLPQAQHPVLSDQFLDIIFTKSDTENTYKKLGQKHNRGKMSTSNNLRIMEQRSDSELDRTQEKDDDRGYILVIVSVFFFIFFGKRIICEQIIIKDLIVNLIQLKPG